MPGNLEHGLQRDTFARNRPLRKDVTGISIKMPGNGDDDVAATLFLKRPLELV